MVIDQLGNVLRGGIGIHHMDRFALTQKVGQHRIVTMQDHPMVKVLVDPLSHRVLEPAKINHHSQVVKLIGLKGDDRLAIVAMNVFSFAIILQKAMAIAKVDFPGHSVHWFTSLA